MKKILGRIGRMVGQPVGQLDALLRRGDGDLFESLWVFVVVVAALHLSALYQASLFFSKNFPVILGLKML